MSPDGVLVVSKQRIAGRVVFAMSRAAIRFFAWDSADFSVESVSSRIAEHTTANRLRANRSAT